MGWHYTCLVVILALGSGTTLNLRVLIILLERLMRKTIIKKFIIFSNMKDFIQLHLKTVKTKNRHNMHGSTDLLLLLVL